MELHPDLMDLLGAFSSSNVEYLVVGGWAVSIHSDVHVISKDDLIAAKRAAGREKDLRDLRALER
jgi:hypothetical protein